MDFNLNNKTHKSGGSLKRLSLHYQSLPGSAMFHILSSTETWSFWLQNQCKECSKGTSEPLQRWTQVDVGPYNNLQNHWKEIMKQRSRHVPAAFFGSRAGLARCLPEAVPIQIGLQSGANGTVVSGPDHPTGTRKQRQNCHLVLEHPAWQNGKLGHHNAPWLTVCKQTSWTTTLGH